MNVVLVVPPMPYSLSDAPDLQFPPLGLCYLAAVARERDHQVALIDMTVSNMGFEELRSKLQAVSPDVVGISCLSAAYPKGLQVAELARQALPSSTIVMGGMHPTFTDRATVLHAAVDVVVRNEGEETFVELLDALDSAEPLDSVLGISYQDSQGDFRRNPERPFIENLDSLPMPAYDLLETMPIFVKLGVFLVVTSRGCPHHCTFCSTSPFWGHTWRGRSVEHVMEEVALLVNNFGAKQIVFGDDNFAHDGERVLELSRTISESRHNIDWRCSVRADSLSAPVLSAMRESGCSAVFIGVESGNQTSLNRMCKRESVEQNVRAVELCRETGIETTCAMLMGLPWETEEDVRENIKFVSETLQPDEVVWNLLHPDPGSKIFEHMEEHGLRFVIQDPERHIGNAPSVIETAHLTADQLNELWMDACLAFEGEETV